MIAPRPLRPELVGQNVREAIGAVYRLGAPPLRDPDVRHLVEVEDSVRADLAGYIAWLEGLATKRLYCERSFDALRRVLEELVRLKRYAGLGDYACGEALQICLSDLVLLEELDRSEVPTATVGALRAELLEASLDLVARLVRDAAKRARTARQAVPNPGDPDVWRLGELMRLAGRPASAVLRDPAKPVLIVATAGRGTRLRTTIPKALVPVGEVPMALRIVRAADAAGIRQVVFALRYRAEVQANFLARYGTVLVHDRAEGTGHTTMLTLIAMADQLAPVLVAYSDTPFLVPGSFQRPLAEIEATEADFVVSTFPVTGDQEYGRVVRDAQGRIIDIGQPRLGSPTTAEADGGVFAFRVTPVLEALGRLRNANTRYEYSLTDLVGELVAAGRRVSTVLGKPEDYLGVNRPRDLVLARLRAATGVTTPTGCRSDKEWTSVIEFFSAYGGDSTVSPQGPHEGAALSALRVGHVIDRYAEQLAELVGPILDLGDGRANERRSRERAGC